MDEEFAKRMAAQQEEIFKHMTPEKVANVLEDIAIRIRDDVPMDDVDIIHLRQIADWLQAHQAEEDVSEDEHTFRQICGWEDAPQQRKEETQP